ncbi:MAG: SIP domain-containing protein [Arachnia propionica]|uniref:SIP domain-containing protein n=1 Tax=Arachnia propionica TaxID=1750 RepID=UPI0026FD54A3|nr:SIP domain-containing protein [Arachnia propionica]
MAHSLRSIDIYPIHIRELEVLRVSDVTPGMRRVTLGGEGLTAHVADNGFEVGAFRSDGFDDEFKLFFTHPDLTEPLLPTQGDGRLVWPHDEKLWFRTYTVRRFDPVAGEVDVDFVRHGVGVASTWAGRVQPGERIHVAGPKSSAGHPEGVDWTLVAGDETALPAIGRWLEQWPDGARGQVFIEVAEDSHRQDLVVPDGVEVTWLSRHGAAPGTTDLLFDAIRAADWWPGSVFAWVAGETLTLTPIRRWLRNEKQLGRDAVEVTGYWRRTKVVASVEDPAIPQPEGSDEHELDELCDLVPGFAVRVGATVGVFDALTDGPLPVEVLARRIGCDPRGVALLAGYLAAVGLLEHQDSGYGLTGMGDLLTDDYSRAMTNLDWAIAHDELAGLLSLLAAVRTGVGDPERWFGGEPSRELASSRVMVAEEEAGYYAATLASSPLLAGIGRLLISGAAAGVVATALVAAHDDLEVAVLAAPSQLEVMQVDHPRVTPVPGSPLGIPEGFDAVLLLGVLDEVPDADALHILGRAPGAVFVFTDVASEHDEDDAHDLGHGLIEFALGRPGMRTDAQWRDLFARAGRQVTGRLSVGWGEHGLPAGRGLLRSVMVRRSSRLPGGGGYRVADGPPSGLFPCGHGRLPSMQRRSDEGASSLR